MEKRIVKEIKIPKGAKNIEARVINGKPYVSYEYYFDPIAHKEVFEEIKGTSEWLDKYFPIVHAGALSLDDVIFKHKPQTINQAFFKKRFEIAYNMGLYNFRAQAMDPSLDENDNIIFKAGEKPAIGKPAIWWDIELKHFFPQKSSRLGSTNERVAFLGVLMKELVENYNYSISDAWYAICDQSREICNCADTIKGNVHIETTGSRKLGKWADLGNEYKITKNMKNGYSLEGCLYQSYGNVCTLSFIIKDLLPEHFNKMSLGWGTMNV